MNVQPHGRESRRSFLRGGVVVAGAAAATTALAVSPAGAGIAIPPAYGPVGPVRIYDSRDGGGKLFPLQERDIQTDVTGVPNGVVALTVNLTITDTEGPGGFLAMFPGDIDWPGTSSVNWFGPGQNLANNAFVRVPASGLVTVRCGGQGGTHFVIDVIGASTLPVMISDVHQKEHIVPVRW